MVSDERSELDEYYDKALKFAKSHYENFPVISSFLKKDQRKHVAVIYQFARQADDIADEGSDPPQVKIEKLNKYEEELISSLSDSPVNGFWKAVKNTILKKNLNKKNFTNLLAAFKQDTEKSQYDSFDELMDYCQLSANPVGRLILELHDINDEPSKNLSDKICTALQLANFYQDVKIDVKKDRIYLPLNELELFNVTINDITSLRYSENFAKFMRFQVERTCKLFSTGRELLKYLPYGLKLQILVTIKGGELVLKKIEELNYNVLDFRPTLSKLDFIKLFLVAIILGK